MTIWISKHLMNCKANLNLFSLLDCSQKMFFQKDAICRKWTGVNLKSQQLTELASKLPLYLFVIGQSVGFSKEILDYGEVLLLKRQKVIRSSIREILLIVRFLNRLENYLVLLTFRFYLSEHINRGIFFLSFTLTRKNR